MRHLHFQQLGAIKRIRVRIVFLISIHTLCVGQINCSTGHHNISINTYCAAMRMQIVKGHIVVVFKIILMYTPLFL